MWLHIQIDIQHPISNMAIEAQGIQPSPPQPMTGPPQTGPGRMGHGVRGCVGRVGWILHIGHRVLEIYLYIYVLHMYTLLRLMGGRIC